jgi:hypothetical protein
MRPTLILTSGMVPHFDQPVTLVSVIAPHCGEAGGRPPRRQLSTERAERWSRSGGGRGLRHQNDFAVHPLNGGVHHTAAERLCRIEQRLQRTVAPDGSDRIAAGMLQILADLLEDLLATRSPVPPRSSTITRIVRLICKALTATNGSSSSTKKMIASLARRSIVKQGQSPGQGRLRRAPVNYSSWLDFRLRRPLQGLVRCTNARSTDRR